MGDSYRVRIPDRFVDDWLPAAESWLTDLSDPTVAAERPGALEAMQAIWPEWSCVPGTFPGTSRSAIEHVP